MIITKQNSFTREEITQLKEVFEIYIKTVIDVEKKICSAGMDRHYEGEQILLNQGSAQSNIWGGGIDLETKTIDFNSFINIEKIPAELFCKKKADFCFAAAAQADEDDVHAIIYDLLNGYKKALVKMQAMS